MTEFEQRVVQQLTELSDRTARVETKLENGLIDGLRAVREWIDGHPRVCPLEKRRNLYVVPITVAILTVVVLKLLDKVVKL